MNALQRHGVEPAPPARFAVVDQRKLIAPAGQAILRVQPHDVAAQRGQPRGEAFGGFMARKYRGAGEIKPDKPGAGTVLKIQMPVPDDGLPMLAGGRVKQV